MYAALWRVLPGARWVRILTLVVGAVAISALLVLWVFPFVDRFVTPQEVTVGQQ